MRKQTIMIIMGFVMVSLVSAMYSGECNPVDLSELESLDNVVYSVVGNSSNLEGLTIDINGTIANICTSLNYKPDSFTLIFLENQTKEIVKTIYVSRGRSRKKVIEVLNVTNWTVINMTKCKDCPKGIIENVTEDPICDISFIDEEPYEDSNTSLYDIMFIIMFSIIFIALPVIILFYIGYRKGKKEELKNI